MSSLTSSQMKVYIFYYIMSFVAIGIILIFISAMLLIFNKIVGYLFFAVVVMPYTLSMFAMEGSIQGWVAARLSGYYDIIYGKKNINKAQYDNPSIDATVVQEQTENMAEEKRIDMIEDHNVLNHTLLYGGAGQGKTALAKVLKEELEYVYGHPIKFIKVSPSQLTSKKQLDEVMLKVVENPYCILFIDEIHGMNRVIEESLYPALQDSEYDITLSEDVNIGGDVRFVLQKDKGVQTIKLPKFTCIGATTLIGEINKPLRDRFPIAIEMEEYTEEQLEYALSMMEEGNEPTSFVEYVGQEKAKKILKYHLESLKGDGYVKPSKEALRLISKISFNTMRVAKQYKRNSVVIAKAKRKDVMDVDDVKEMMQLYGINEEGLARPHLAIIKALLERWKYTPEGKSYSLGSRALANVANVTKADIDEIYVPMLTKAGIIELDGRSMKQLTPKAIKKYEYLLDE